MGQRKLAQHGRAGGRQPHDYLAAVLLAEFAGHVPMLFQAAHQLHSAVMLELQPFGQFADGCLGAIRQSLDRQQKLVLLRFHPQRTNLFFAEAKKAPDLMPELSQSAVLIQS